MILTNKAYSDRYKNKFRLNINKNNICQVDEFKYLGVIMDNKLTWKKHIEYLQTKLSTASGIIYKTRTYMPLNARMLVYNSLVDSYLRYGITAWGTSAAYLIERLQASQNRVLKSVLFPNTALSNNSQYYKRLNILSVMKLYTNQMCSFMHSIFFGYNPPAFDSTFTVCPHNYSTRHAQNAHFALIRPRTEMGKKSVQYAGVKCWENIPLQLKECKNPKTFKSALKQNLLS